MKCNPLKKKEKKRKQRPPVGVIVLFEDYISQIAEIEP